MTKHSDFQVSPSRRPIRECVGLIVNGTNTAAAIKTKSHFAAYWGRSLKQGGGPLLTKDRRQ